MLRIIATVALAALAAPAAATDDARDIIARQIQEMNDAVGSGAAAVWEKYLDANAVYVAEDGSISNKADMVKQITPLPPGISGTIKVEVMQFHRDGDVAAIVVRQHETENYFGQTLHAEYLATNVWRRRAGAWKLIAAQVLAENQDPRAMDMPLARLQDFAGTYHLNGGTLDYSIVLKDGKVMGNRTGRDPVQLNAEAPDVLFVAGQPRIRKIFLRDANGRVTGFVDRREGRDVVWTKTH